MKHFTQITSAILLGLGILILTNTARAEDPKLSYKIGKGLTIESPDDNFKITIGGYVQPRFTYSHLESAPYTDTFAIQRGKITLDGNIYKKTLKYGFAMNLATRAVPATGTNQTGLAVLDDYFIDWVPNDFIGIKVGQFKVPFEIQELTSDTKLQFVDRSLSNGLFDFTRDIGINLHGRLLNNRFGYNAFLFNGQGQNTLNTAQGMMGGVRIDYSFLGQYELSESDVDMSEKINLGMGLGYLYASEMNFSGNISELSTITAGTRASNGTWDAGLKYKGWSTQLQAMITRTHENGNLTNWGYNAQVGYMVVPHHFEVALKQGGAVFSNAVRNEYEYGVGLNYFIKGHPIKIQTDYTYLVNARAATLNDNRARVQLQLMF